MIFTNDRLPVVVKIAAKALQWFVVQQGILLVELSDDRLPTIFVRPFPLPVESQFYKILSNI